MGKLPEFATFGLVSWNAEDGRTLKEVEQADVVEVYLLRLNFAPSMRIGRLTLTCFSRRISTSAHALNGLDNHEI